MSHSVLLFEDHAAQAFRPLSWTVPVYEMGCGAFNLRERLVLCLEDRGDDASVVLLPRTLLAGVQAEAVPAGCLCGPDAAADRLEGDGRVLWLNARFAGRWSELRSLLDSVDEDVLWSDSEGPVAWSSDAAAAREALASWRAWDVRAHDSGAWAAAAAPVEPWDHAPQGERRDAPGWTHLWNRVLEIGHAVADDVREVMASGRPYRRWVWGAVPEEGATPPWALETACRPMDQAKYPHVSVVGGRGVWIGGDVRLDPGVVIDVREGPVVLERDVTVQANSVLNGPLFVGAGTIVKAGAVVYGETAVGPVCRMSGEIAETQAAAYVNKQHAGFLGHAVIGSWVNLGADTTCSDLKNNYGEIKVNYGLGPVATGTRFLGLMMAEHAKSAIGTTFNTATTVGVSANVFASGFPRITLPNFAWGDGRGRRFQVDRALETARIVMSRRGMVCTDAHEAVMRVLYEGTEPPSRAQDAS